MSKHQEEFAQFHAVAQVCTCTAHPNYACYGRVANYEKGATIDLFRKLKAAYEKKHEARVSFMETLKEKGMYVTSILMSSQIIFFATPFRFDSTNFARWSRFVRRTA